MTDRAVARLRLRGEVDGDTVSFPLRDGPNRIGGTADNDLVLGSRAVSRHHAIVTLSGGSAVVEDVGSKNGVFVNGVRVKASALRAGDTVGIGPLKLLLDAVDPEDVSLAISIPSRSGSPLGRDTTRSGTQTAAAPGQAAVDWLGLSRGLARRLVGQGPEGWATALEALTSSLGATGALLLRSEAPSEDLTVLSGHGGLPDLAEVGKRLAGAAEGSTEGPVPLLWVSTRSAAGGAVILSVAGAFPGRPEAHSFLRLVLELLLSATGSLSATDRPIGQPLPTLRFPLGFVAGSSTSMKELFRDVRHLLRGDIPVLILGETGVGKELVARAIHASSDRSGGPFVAINCAAIPAELLEAELFGVARGAATGVLERRGTLEAASGGVVLFDEVGELPLALQAKLLRALQQREVHSVGGRTPRPIDVRILSATNTDLQARIADGRFRRDLYHRIAGATVRVPPLRERREDIPPLVERFLRAFSAEAQKDVPGMTVKALRAFVRSPWPGNVRELEHEVRRLVCVCPNGQPIDSSLLSPALLSASSDAASSEDSAAASDELDLARQTAALERRLIEAALAKAGGNRSRSARLLGISRNTLLTRIRRLGLGD